MPAFRALLLFDLRQRVTPEVFESFVKGEYEEAYRALNVGLTAVEVLRRERASEQTSPEYPSPDYLIVESWRDLASHHELWRSEKGRAILAGAAGTRLLAAIHKLDKDLAKRVGSFHGTVARPTAAPSAVPTSLTVQQAAARLGISTATRRRRIGSGQLIATKVAGAWRIPASELV